MLAIARNFSSTQIASRSARISTKFPRNSTQPKLRKRLRETLARAKMRSRWSLPFPRIFEKLRKISVGGPARRISRICSGGEKKIRDLCEMV